LWTSRKESSLSKENFIHPPDLLLPPAYLQFNIGYVVSDYPLERMDMPAVDRT
jgi:hypothetical protein